MYLVVSSVYLTEVNNVPANSYIYLVISKAAVQITRLRWEIHVTGHP